MGLLADQFGVFAHHHSWLRDMGVAFVCVFVSIFAVIWLSKAAFHLLGTGDSIFEKP